MTPIARGAWTALLAATAFGVTTPLVQRAGEGVGALATAALLYAGAMIASVPALWEHNDAPLQRAHAPRLVAVALCGGAIAPALLAWGLQRTSATTASLLLNLEAVFTVLLARALYREAIGRRVALALVVIACGGALLLVDGLRGAPGATGASWGAAAVGGATLAWALDNALTRPLADVSAGQVVLWKGLLGACGTAIVACILHESAPPLWRAMALLACGATGYGLSLRLYLRAQRALGAARTASIFAAGPFVGAFAAMALGDRAPTLETAIAGVLLAAGVALHVTEQHHHAHAHDAIDHEHAHRHDDGHHAHAHDPPVVGEHSHPHHHDRLEHTHDHAPDIHHGHRH